MDIEKLIFKLSEEMGVSLQEKNKEVYGLVQTTELFNQEDYYGFLVLGLDRKGEMNYCAYEGKHPILNRKGEFRTVVGLHLESDLDGIFRVDSNLTSFLGYEKIDYKKLSKSELQEESNILVVQQAQMYIFLDINQVNNFL